MNSVIILPEAKLDIQDTASWYDHRRKGLGRKFTSAVRQKADQIKNSPESYPFRFQETRGALLDKFPFWIFFKEFKEQKQILIIAVLSCFRDPGKIEKRLV